jgi:hypothetical protein
VKKWQFLVILTHNKPMRVSILLFLLLICLSGPINGQIMPVPNRQETVAPISKKLAETPSELSSFSIPISVDLVPFFKMAELAIDTVFASDGYPEQWVLEGCDLRYKYVFKRSPLTITAQKNNIKVGFIGSYFIIGESRLCVSGKAISPWSPSCSCGLNEKQRMATIEFNINFNIQNDYKIRTTISVAEPKALNNCEVCFFGKDVTKQVMTGLKQRLIEAKKEMENNYGLIDFKSVAQQVWIKLQAPYPASNYGWLYLNPVAISLNSIEAKGTQLKVVLGYKGDTQFLLEQKNIPTTTLPPLSNFKDTAGFTISLTALMQYDSLSKIINEQLRGTTIKFKKGFIKKEIVIDSCQLVFGYNNRVQYNLYFSGSDKGLIKLLGELKYNETNEQLNVDANDFSMETDNAVMNYLDWLLKKKILHEIEKKTSITLTPYYENAKKLIEQQLSREWTTGLVGNCKMKKLKLVSTRADIKYFEVKLNAEGNLNLQVDKIPSNPLGSL